jgi:hypothetical protein
VGITFDPSTPGAPHHTGTTTPLTTSAFTPPDGSFVLVMAGAGWCATPPIGMTFSDSGGNTWTVPSGSTAIGVTTNNGGGVSIAYHYFVYSPGSITVSVAYTGLGTGGGTFIDLLVFSGAASDHSAAATAKNITTSGTVGTVSITTTKAGSWVWGIGDDSTSNTTFTANAATTVDVLDTDGPADGVTMVGWRATALTGTPGATTLGGTWGATAASNNAAFEVLPALATPPKKSLTVVKALTRSYRY